MNVHVYASDHTCVNSEVMLKVAMLHILVFHALLLK